MGSRAGRPNKQKQALVALLKKQYPGWEPVCDMAEAAQAMMRKARESDELQDWVTASALCDRVARYITPQLKAIEVSANDGQPLKIGLVQFDSDSGKTDGL